MSDLYHPSWQQGFARYAGESEDPSAWKGLAAHYATSLGPTGLTLRDVSGRHKHGTPVGPTWVMSERGSVLNYVAASEQYVQLPAFSFAGPFTIAMWVRFGAFGFIAGANNNNYISVAAGLVIFKIAGVNSVLDFAPALSTGTWCHFAFVRDANDLITTYVDGRAQTDTDTNGGTWEFSVLGAKHTGSGWLDGLIGDVALWSRAAVPSAKQIDDMLRLRSQVPLGVAGAGPTTAELFAATQAQYTMPPKPHLEAIPYS